MLYDDPFERRSGADRRRNVDKANGMSVLLAGCPKCDRIAPSPIEMHIEGWEMVWEGDRLISITCPKHRNAEEPSNPDDAPGYVIPSSGRS